MREIYAAAYRFERTAEGALRPIALDPEVVCPPQDWQPSGDMPGFGVGTGFAAGDGLLQTRLQSRLRAVDAAALPQAADVAVLARIAFAEGGAVAPEHLEPAYLRNQVALTIAEQQALRDARQSG
jgi:tRNA threonylcarbamoyladenosine biosynthesis protein TsaB